METLSDEIKKFLSLYSKMNTNENSMEISVGNSLGKYIFDTNVSNHHHFFDEDTNELIDCDEQIVETPKIKKNISGKKINSVEVLIKVATDNQNQK